MWTNIVKEIKISTVLEKVILGIIAGIFAVIGYYVGYTHLSNGVQPVLIGIITAVILMVACMLISFIGEELLRRMRAGSKEDKEDEPKKAETAKQETVESTDTGSEEANVAKLESNELTDAEDASTGLQVPSEEVIDMAVENSSFKPVKPVTEPVKPSEDAPMMTRRQRRASVAPVKAEPVEAKMEKVEVKNEPVVVEEPKVSVTLKEFIASHPDYAPRKMAREYRAAGGTESTDNILELMS